MKKPIAAAILLASVAAVAAEANIKRAQTPVRRTEAPVVVDSKSYTPFAIGLFPPVALPWCEMDVKGLRLNLPYAGSADIEGLDIGIVNISRSNADALQIGLYNDVYNMRGLQIGIVNVAGRMEGVQIGLANIIRNSDVAFFPVVNFWF